jgi:hypothetical protein
MTDVVFNDPINVAIQCKICKEDQVIRISEADLKKWQDGELVQNAFPYLSADQRELFITGFCGKCYDNLFKEE